MKARGRVSDYQPARRRCLGPECSREFASQGPGHRYCPRCRGKLNVVRGGLARRALEVVRDPRGGAC